MQFWQRLNSIEKKNEKATEGRQNYEGQQLSDSMQKKAYFPKQPSLGPRNWIYIFFDARFSDDPKRVYQKKVCERLTEGKSSSFQWCFRSFAVEVNQNWQEICNEHFRQVLGERVPAFLPKKSEVVTIFGVFWPQQKG